MRTLLRYLRRPKLMLGLGLVGGLWLASNVLPLPYDPYVADPYSLFLPPGAQHWFGTDEVGGDLFSRSIRAGRTDLGLAVSGTAAAVIIGISLGLLASIRSKWSERGLRVLDIFQSLPLLIVVLAMVALSGRQLWVVIFAIAIFSTPVYIRLVRTELLSLRESRFVEAARASGASEVRILWRHLLPNLAPILLAQMSLTLAGSILTVAALSFLGAGAGPPIPSWGLMIRTGSQSLATGYWWMVAFPGAAIFLTVLSANIIGEDLRDSARRSLGRGSAHRTTSRSVAADSGPAPVPTVPTALGGPQRPLLAVSGMVVEYVDPDAPTVHAVNGVSFSLAPGDIVGIVGESGSGKSTVVRALLGLQGRAGRIVGGTAEFAGAGDLLTMKNRDLRELRGEKIGYMGQNPFGALHPILRVEEQFRSLLHAHHRHSGRRVTREIGLAALQSVGIADPQRVLRAYPHQLSGGMIQRVVIAMALMLKPKLVIADEPTTGLDLTVQRQILDLILARAADEGLTVLLVTHDLGVVAQYCRNVVVMYAGKVVESGPVGRVFLEPAHPYTAALLNAVPQRGRPLRPLLGRLPSLYDYPTGCPFMARCPHAFAACERPPALRAVSAEQLVSCHLDLIPQMSEMSEIREISAFAPTPQP